MRFFVFFDRRQTGDRPETKIGKKPAKKRKNIFLSMVYIVFLPVSGHRRQKKGKLGF